MTAPVNAPQKPINLLVVDDSAMMRAMLKRAAQLSGVALGAIYEAANGEEALRLLEANSIDAIFTDINMPVMTGIELLQTIDERRQWPDLVRVIISADGSTINRQQADSLSTLRYIAKPFRPEAIRDVLASIL